MSVNLLDVVYLFTTSAADVLEVDLCANVIKTTIFFRYGKYAGNLAVWNRDLIFHKNKTKSPHR